MNEEQIRAEVRQRISAIMGSQEAKGASNLAEHLAYELEMSVEDAIGALKAFHADGSKVSRQTSPAQSWENRKRAAGTLGLAPAADTEGEAGSGWSAAIKRFNEMERIGEPDAAAEALAASSEARSGWTQAIRSHNAAAPIEDVDAAAIWRKLQ